MTVRCLSTRELNALRIALDKRYVSVEDVAALDYGRLTRLPGVGRKSVANIRAWLAEQGRTLCNDDEDGGGKVVEGSARDEVRTIQRAIDYLHEHGYKVLPPQA